MLKFNPADRLTINNSAAESSLKGRREKRRKNVRFVFLAAFLLLVVAAASAAFFFKPGAAAETPLEFAGKIINVRRGGNLQVAINQAKPGDTIVLEAGAEFVGSFELPAKAGSEFVTIQSSRLAELPENVRVKPSQSALMPKIVSPGAAQSAIFTAPKAHHYRFVGVEIVSGGKEYVYNLVALGSDNQKSEDVPKFFEFDRCYVHARVEGSARRGFALNNSETTIKNSYVSAFASVDDETQAIAGWNGPGPFKIINNYLEGGSENVMFGGATAQPGMNPADLEFRRNHLAKPWKWQGKLKVKNLFELKDMRRAVIEENVLENNWASGQDGTAILLTPASLQSGPQARVQDIVFRSNIVRHSSNAVTMTGTDYGDPKYPNLPVQNSRVRFENNLFEDISAKAGEDNAGRFLLLTSGAGPDDLTFDHNTVLHRGSTIILDGCPCRNFVFTNNIVMHNEYGVIGSGKIGTKALSAYFSGAVFRRNIVVGAETENYPSDNFYPARLDAIGFSDLKTSNYRLNEASKFRMRATDNKDIGCDFSSLSAMEKKVLAGTF